MALIRLNSIFAYVASGLLLGPVLGVVEPTEDLAIFTGIGIFLLFFIIGLDEIDIAGFVEAIRGRYFLAALVSVVASMIAALMVTSDLFGFSFSLGLGLKDSLALAGILSMSSLGLVAKVLQDGGHLREPIGLKIFAIVIIAEALALLLVGFTIGEHFDEVALWGVLELLAEMTAFVIASWLLSTRVLPPAISALRRFLDVPELSFGLLIGGLFLMVVGAEEIQLHGSIGALLFGSALSGLPESVRKEVRPGLRSSSEGLFVPLFFASAGLNFDLSFTELPASTILALVFVPLIGKFFGAFVGTYMIRVDMPLAMAAGLMAKGVAEIAFLLVLLDHGVIEQGVFSLLVLIMFGYILFMPLAINFAIERAKSSDSDVVPKVVPRPFTRYALDGIRTGTVMDTGSACPSPHVTVQEFTDDWIAVGAHSSSEEQVVVEAGRVVGIVSTVKLHLVSPSLWSTTPLRTVLRDKAPVARPEEPLLEVLERMQEHSLTVIPVAATHTEEFLGVVTSREVMDLMTLMDDIQRELKSMSSKEG